MKVVVKAGGGDDWNIFEIQYQKWLFFPQHAQYQFILKSAIFFQNLYWLTSKKEIFSPGSSHPLKNKYISISYKTRCWMKSLWPCIMCGTDVGHSMMFIGSYSYKQLTSLLLCVTNSRVTNSCHCVTNSRVTNPQCRI